MRMWDVVMEQRGEGMYCTVLWEMYIFEFGLAPKGKTCWFASSIHRIVSVRAVAIYTVFPMVVWVLLA